MAAAWPHGVARLESPSTARALEQDVHLSYPRAATNGRSRRLQSAVRQCRDGAGDLKPARHRRGRPCATLVLSLSKGERVCLAVLPCRGGLPAASPESPKSWCVAWPTAPQSRGEADSATPGRNRETKRNYAPMHLTNSHHRLELSCHIGEALWGHQHMVVRWPSVRRAEASRTCGREVTKGGAVWLSSRNHKRAALKPLAVLEWPRSSTP